MTPSARAGIRQLSGASEQPLELGRARCDVAEAADAGKRLVRRDERIGIGGQGGGGKERVERAEPVVPLEQAQSWFEFFLARDHQGGKPDRVPPRMRGGRRASPPAREDMDEFLDNAKRRSADDLPVPDRGEQSAARLTRGMLRPQRVEEDRGVEEDQRRRA